MVLFTQTLYFVYMLLERLTKSCLMYRFDMVECQNQCTFKLSRCLYITMTDIIPYNIVYIVLQLEEQVNLKFDSMKIYRQIQKIINSFVVHVYNCCIEWKWKRKRPCTFRNKIKNIKKIFHCKSSQFKTLCLWSV